MLLSCIYIPTEYVPYYMNPLLTFSTQYLSDLVQESGVNSRVYKIMVTLCQRYVVLPGDTQSDAT